MLIQVNDSNEITGKVSISNPLKETEFLRGNPGYIQIPDGAINLPIECYEHVDGQVGLKSNYEEVLEQLNAWKSPSPEPSSDLKIVVSDGIAQDEHGTWQQVWKEVDRFQDIPGGPTKAEQEAEFLTQKMEQAKLKLKNESESAIIDHIQSKVDAYNQAHGLLFDSVHSCESYSRVSGYSHRPFCAAVWAWSVDVWETARSILAQAVAGEITITSPDDVIALLPEFTFTEDNV